MTKANSAARKAAAMVAMAVALPAAARADSATPTYIGTTEQDVGVMDRARPAYDAKGIPLGGFRLFPTLLTKATFDDNVFKRNTAQSDWFVNLAPAARLMSQWGRHFVELYSGLDYYNYSTFAAQNLADWNIGADGRLDISRSANVRANVFYAYEHELWSAPNVTGFQAAPNRYFQTHTDTVAVYQPNRLGFSAGGSFDSYNWTTTPRNGGGFLYNDDRDQNEYQAFFKTYYDFSPGYSGYLKASYDERDFAMFFDRSGLHRSSHGYRIDAGVNLQITHLLAGEIYAGYLEQNFAQNVPHPLKNVSGLDYGVQLDWFVSPILTLHAAGKRSLDDVVLTNISMADNKKIELSADYEFRPDTILQGRVSYENSRYVGSTRHDDNFSGGFGVKHFVNRHVSLELNYDYSDRSTDVGAFKYTDNTVSLGIKFHM